MTDSNPSGWGGAGDAELAPLMRLVDLVLIYLALWLTVPVLCLPGTPLGLAAGALFGSVKGSLYTLIGATAGATLAFLVARYLAGDWVASRRLWQLFQTLFNPKRVERTEHPIDLDDSLHELVVVFRITSFRSSKHLDSLLNPQFCHLNL